MLSSTLDDLICEKKMIHCMSDALRFVVFVALLPLSLHHLVSQGSGTESVVNINHPDAWTTGI